MITDPDDYKKIIKNIKPSLEERKELAGKAFEHVEQYDACITDYFCRGKENNSKIVRSYTRIKELRYGLNPHQKKAGMYAISGNKCPITFRNGVPSYINMLDALNAWQLVKEAKEALEVVCAASFKHVSPAGVGLGCEISTVMKKLYGVENQSLTPTARAFIRARFGDPKSSYGDFMAFSDEIDEQTALLIKPEVTDGIIAPSYSDAAFNILKTKKEGAYIIMQMDPKYKNFKLSEFREIYGIALSQEPNYAVTNNLYFENRVTKNKSLPEQAKRDLILANITLKYTQSNSVTYAKDGQLIGIGAGQQNRVDCVNLAGEKAKWWHLRQHPMVAELFSKFKPEVKRQDKINVIVNYLKNKNLDLTLFKEEVKPFKIEDQYVCSDVALASDAFFPFADNIDAAAQYGVKYIVQPGGSIRDDEVIEACDKHGMVMMHTGVRLFTH